MAPNWEIARLTSINKTNGVFEVYIGRLGCSVKGQLTDLIDSHLQLHDRVRVQVERLPYALRIKMILKTRSA